MVTGDYKTNVDNEPEGEEPNDDKDTQKEEKEKNIDAEYAKMELFSNWLLDSKQCTIMCNIRSCIYMSYEDLR